LAQTALYFVSDGSVGVTGIAPVVDGISGSSGIRCSASEPGSDDIDCAAGYLADARKISCRCRGSP
jgi:hypothetical protein